MRFRYRRAGQGCEELTVFLLFLSLIGQCISRKATWRLGHRAVRINDGGPFPPDTPLGQPVDPPTCTSRFGEPKLSHCQRAAGGSRSSRPVGGMEWEEVGINLSRYYGSSPRNMDGFEPRVFFMPRTYAYGECVIWVGGAPTLGELEYDLAAMNTLRWETVVMAGICSQGTVGDHHTGGLLVAGQNQKIWIGMLKLPRQLQRPMRQNVALNDPDHRLILAGCEWGNPKNPTDPAQACPFWGMFEDGGDSGGQRFVSAGDSADQDQNSELEAGAGANAQDIETGLQYCLATNNGASTCGWAAACKPQPPPETLLSRVLWGIRSIYDSVGICAANSKAVSALSITD